ncbi:MAG: hypothetical protein NC182_07640 [Prevotella sp.]|nr:hypothetical protein [Staphylococcus sp.]MCM1351056.1 hypothetical protein [Prevotella sp.]
MNKKYRFLQWLKKPHGVGLGLFYVFAVATIVGAIYMATIESSVLAYVIYGLSAVSLAYMVYTIVYYVPIIKKRIIHFARQYPFIHHLLDNYGFRTIIFTTFSFCINVGYAIFEGILGIVFLSVWYMSLSGYYLILSIARGSILWRHQNRKKKRDQIVENPLQQYQHCGILLVVLTLALSIAIIQMVYANKGFIHLGFTIYASAAYTFYKLTMSIIHLVKAKKEKDYHIQSLRNIGFAEALVSVLALQTAMLASFSDGQMNLAIWNAITGGVVVMIILALGVYMIIVGNLKQKRGQDK